MSHVTQSSVDIKDCKRLTVTPSGFNIAACKPRVGWPRTQPMVPDDVTIESRSRRLSHSLEARVVPQELLSTPVLLQHEALSDVRGTGRHQQKLHCGRSPGGHRACG